MQKSKLQLKTQKIIFAISIIVFVCIYRLIPHPANFAPITALALFGGAYLDKKYALLVPLVAMFVSDIFLGFHSDMIFVYGSFLLIGLLGIRLKSHRNFKNILFTAIFSSILFFVITNFGVWLMTDMYSKNAQGLLTAFILAIPFFKNTIMGDLLFTGMFFAAFEFFRAQLFKKSQAFVEATQPKD